MRAPRHVQACAGTACFAASGVAGSDYPHLTLSDAIVEILIPVTIGNIIGGSVMVGIAYGLIYVRTES